MGHFVCPFTPLTICKIGILKKWKKHLQILLVYTSVSKMKSSCMVPEIWSMTDRMFVILGHFLHFYYTSNLKIKVFKKLKKLKKKTSGDIIILHICTINDNHMMYGSWDMECDRYNFLPFWVIFCPFTPVKTQKIKTLKKMKKTPECHMHSSPFDACDCMCTPQHTHQQFGACKKWHVSFLFMTLVVQDIGTKEMKEWTKKLNLTVDHFS